MQETERKRKKEKKEIDKEGHPALLFLHHYCEAAIIFFYTLICVITFSPFLFNVISLALAVMPALPVKFLFSRKTLMLGSI